MTGIAPVPQPLVAGRYRIREQGPGRGRSAHDDLLDREVRLLAVEGTSDDDAVSTRQAALSRLRSVERFSHPYLVPVADVVVADGAWAVTPPRPGPALAELPEPPGGALAEQVAEDLLRALAALHEQGLPHLAVSTHTCLLTGTGARLDVPALGPVTGQPVALLRTDLDRLADVVAGLRAEPGSRLEHLEALLHEPTAPDAAEVLRRWTAVPPVPAPTIEVRQDTGPVDDAPTGPLATPADARPTAAGGPAARSRPLVDSVVLLLVSLAAALLLLYLVLS